MTDQDEQKLLAGLAALANRTEAPPTRMEGVLLGAFRAEQRAKARRRNWIAYGAIAASVAMLISAAMLTRREPPVQLAALPKVETQMAEAVTAAPVPAQRAITAKPAVRRSPPRLRAVREVAEVATQFMPMPDASILAPIESGRVVRVRIPRSAMLEFGLPINENRASELVRADVVLGEDGLARAIRFVQ